MVKFKAEKNLKRKFLAIAAIAVSLLLFKGCYLLEQTIGQLDLRLNQVALDEAIRTEKDSRIKRLLGEVERIKKFGEDRLNLKSSENYSGYYRTEKQGITFVVTASAKTELVPYTWWFPVVGHVPYKGFFDKEDALALERELQEEGYDTWVFAAPTYSSLGWFRDPITTPMLRKGIYGLANAIFHEMTHATLYVDNQTDFNERLAVFVGHRGAMEYLRSGNREPEFFRRIEKQRKRAARLAATTQKTYRLLQDLYEKRYPSERTQLEKGRLFGLLTEEILLLFPDTDPSRWQYNNARLLQSARYRPESPVVAGLWQKGGGDWQKFWQSVRQYTERQGW